MNKRELKLKEYGISEKRYKELCGFCEQYPEWQKELMCNTDTVGSKTITDMPVLRRAELKENKELIEKTLQQLDDERDESMSMYKYILNSVCYEKPHWYLRDIMGMPYSRTSFYEARRYFFYLLDRNKRIKFREDMEID